MRKLKKGSKAEKTVKHIMGILNKAKCGKDK